MKYKIIPAFILFITCSLLALCLTIPCFAASTAEDSTSSRTVRVGCVDIKNFFIKNGRSVSGYGADYLKEISKYTGWNYKYVRGTWEECMKWLSEGKIDLLFPAEYDKERASQYIYSSIDCCLDYVALLTYNDNNTLYYEDFKNYEGITVGMIKGNYLNTCFRKFAAEKGFGFTPKYYDTRGQLSDALTAHKVDALVTGNLDVENDSKLLAKFDYMPAYMIGNKNNPQLMKDLDNALYRITLENPYFTAELIDKYYGSQTSLVKGYSKEEADFIKSARTLRVVCDSNNPPFEWYDKKAQKYCGLDIDILKMISKNSGLKFEYVYTDSFDTSWKKLLNGQADILAGAFIDDALSDSYNLTATEQYCSELYFAAGRSADKISVSKKLQVAVPRSLIGLKQYIKTHYTNWSVHTYDTTEDCLKAVKKGSADLTFISSLSLQTNPLFLDYPSLTTRPGLSINLPLSLGISKNCPEILQSILNKSINEIDNSDIQQLVTTNTQLDRDMFSIKNLIRFQPALFSGIIIFVCAILAGMLFMLYRSREKNRQARQLNEKNMELKAANDAKTNFFSCVSHDLRTPMNGILGLTHLCKNETDPQILRHSIEQINITGNYLLDLINDVLDMTKIENSQIALHPGPVRGEELIEKLRSGIRPLVLQKHINFKVIVPSAPWVPVYADVPRIQQIFMNIIGNAIKFTPAGGSITVQVQHLEENRDYILDQYTVTDTGIGISSEFIPHLFEPFIQEHNNNEYEGTGLGMPIVKQLITSMDGEIHVSSEKGKGTEVRFTLKLMRCQEEHLPQQEQQTPLNLACLKGMCILVCEDHPLNATITLRLLEQQQIIAQHAANGRIGLELFSQSENGYYDAILMDIRMPIMNGLEAARSIRALSRPDAQTVPIIALTANAMEEDIQQSLESGMNRHLSKPIDPEKLYQVLAEFR